jgi:hypothetical protein
MLGTVHPFVDTCSFKTCFEWKHRALPNPSHAELIKDLVDGYDRDVLQLRLRGKHAIKRVPVGAGQRACSSGMSNRDVKALKLLAGNTRRYITRNFSGSREFAESELRCDFPGGGGTDEYGIRFLANDSPRFPCQPGIAVKPPTKMHGYPAVRALCRSQALNSSSRKGSKNARVTRARPFIEPNLRCGASSRMGTSLTTGVLPRAITTSSPAQAHSMSRERFVFAS